MEMPSDLAASIKYVIDQWFINHLSQCTPGQRERFYRMYPNGPTQSQIPNAANQVLQTIRKNGTKN